MIILTVPCFAQQEGQSYGVSLSAQYGTTIAHTSKISNLRSNYPLGIQVDLFRQKSDQQNYDFCNCFPQSGLSVSYWDYGNRKVVGQGLQFAIYLEPQFKVFRNHYFILRATAGLTYLTNPYDSISNPDNLAYSLPVSGYVSLGPGWRYFINPHYSVFLITAFNHISNGGIKDPNLGLNFPGVHFGLTKQFQSLNRDFKRSPVVKSKKNVFDASLFFSSRTVKNGEKKRFLIYGAEFSYSKNNNRILSWHNGLEFYRDEALRERYRREDGVDRVRYRSGLMSGVQFNLGKFELTHRLGFYIYDPGNYNGRIFHRHGLNYLFHPKWSAGLQVKAHAEVANFLDFRILYRIRSN